MFQCVRCNVSIKRIIRFIKCDPTRKKTRKKVFIPSAVYWHRRMMVDVVMMSVTINY